MLTTRLFGIANIWLCPCEPAKFPGYSSICMMMQKESRGSDNATKQLNFDVAMATAKKPRSPWWGVHAQLGRRDNIILEENFVGISKAVWSFLGGSNLLVAYLARYDMGMLLIWAFIGFTPMSCASSLFSPHDNGPAREIHPYQIPRLMISLNSVQYSENASSSDLVVFSPSVV